jgi:hypothetical protein
MKQILLGAAFMVMVFIAFTIVEETYGFESMVKIALVIILTEVFIFNAKKKSQ